MNPDSGTKRDIKRVNKEVTKEVADQIRNTMKPKSFSAVKLKE